MYTALSQVRLIAQEFSLLIGVSHLNIEVGVERDVTGGSRIFVSGKVAVAVAAVAAQKIGFSKLHPLLQPSCRWFWPFTPLPVCPRAQSLLQLFCFKISSAIARCRST
jgi:hypothetical protein